DSIDDVISGLKRIIELCPEQVLAHQSLAECLLAKKDYQEAIKELSCLLELSSTEVDVVIMKTRQIINQDKALLEANLLLAKAYYVKEEYKKARIELDRVFLIEKDYLLGLVLLARIEYEEENFRSAIWNLRKALSSPGKNKMLSDEFHKMYWDILLMEVEKIENELRDRENPELRFDLARKYYSLNQLDIAMGQFQQLLKNVEYMPEALYYLGKCFKEQGNFELALRQFQKALQIKDIQHEKYLLEAGLCGEALGELNKAADIYQEIVENNTLHEKAKSYLGRLNSNSWMDLRGKTMLGLWNHSLVLLWYKNPEMDLLDEKKNKNLFEISFAQSHNNQGVEFAQKGRMKAAEDEFILALQLDRNFTTTHNNLGVIYLKQGRIEEAKQKFRDTIILNPSFYVAHYNYALACYLETNMEEARCYFEQAVMMDPGLKNVALNYGDVLYENGDLESAISIWRDISRKSVLYELGQRKLQFIGVE
ncbi:MAG: tetratricopeptide repeat protein, partial [Candidatus Margulisiibacteriota bacterium]